MSPTLFSSLIKLMAVVLISGMILTTESVANEVVLVGGAGSGLGVMKILGDEFEKSHPGISIKVMSSLGTSGGIKAVAQRKLDIAITSRALSAEEVLSGVISLDYARTPLILVVNNNVDKQDLTTVELEMIYKNELKRWPNGDRIRLVHRLKTETDTLILASISRDLQQSINDTGKIIDRKTALTDQEAIEIVSTLSGAICSSTLVQFLTEKPKIKILSYNGIKPTIEALEKGIYPLSKPLFLVTTKNRSNAASRFINYLYSARGRAILAKSGTIPSFKYGGAK